MRITETSTPTAAPATPGLVPAATSLRGRAPARNKEELADLMRRMGLPRSVLLRTAAWLSSDRRQSPRTHDAYSRDLSWWLAYLAARGLDPAHVPASEADLYAGALRAAGLAASTRARRISAASSWSRYLARYGEAADPFAGMDRPKAPRHSTTRGLSRDELTRMLDHARRYESARTYAILAVLIVTACRASSLIGADLAGYGSDRGHRTLDAPVKGGQTKRWVLPPLACDAIDTYLAERGTAPGPLFISSRGRRLTQPYLHEMVNRVARAAGVPFPISLHGIRHSVITALLSQGTPLHIVQDLAGHADPRTTRRYDRAAGELDRSPAYDIGRQFATALAEMDRDRADHARTGHDRPRTAPPIPPATP